MGRLNDTLCDFINKPEIFAELFNAGVFNGQKVIGKENLADVQRTYGETLADRYGKRKIKIRERDVIKALLRDGRYVRLAVENQANLNYCMPLRCLEYDVEDFARQLRRIQRQYKQEGGLRPGAEYLSGIKETDKLIPNITVVLYHGPGKWNAAERLQDMLDVTAMDERLKAIHMDYRLHIINLTELDESLLKTGLRELVGMLKRADDRERLQQYLEDNEARFREMDDDLYDLICMMLGMKELLKRKDDCKNQGKETFDMCVAFQEMLRDSKEQGKRIGRKEGEKRGEKRGAERLGALISRMYEDGRMEEVLKAAKNERFRSKLYREYGI